MRLYFTMLLLVARLCCCCPAQASTSRERDQAEYYVSTFAQHYGVPLALVRSVVQQESAWHACTTSPKGAVGLMQLMPQTAKRLGVTNRCDIRENVSGGVRYLAWLIRLFHGDLRLVAAAYYAGEQVVAKRGLSYGNPDVVAYVAHVRALYRQNVRELPQLALLSRTKKR
jgi:soluble lytic murein transglycosylase-like protein